MFNAPLLGNGRCHGSGIMADDWVRPPKFRPNRSINASYNISNIFQYGGRPPSWIGILSFLTTHKVSYAVRLCCQNLVSIRSSPSEILRFYDFASLAGKCPTTPPFWGFSGGLNPLKLWVVIKTHKRHVLGWQRVIQAINGKNPSSSVSWARLRWKKVYRTTSHKSVIFHIWVQVGC